MKKAYSIILIVLFFLSIASCGPGQGANPRNAAQTADKIESLLQEDLTGEITVAFFETMPYEKFLDEAAYLFEFNHPGTRINIAPFSTMFESSTYEMDGGVSISVIEGWDEAATNDYINRINTELMSGKGPDVLAMDVLPFHKYAESGYLEDLRSFMEADETFDMSGYQRNIIEGTRYKSGQYLIPLGYRFFFITLDKSRVNGATAAALREKGKFTYWELTDAVRDQFMGDESGAMVIDFQEGASRAARRLFISNYRTYVDLENKKARFADGDFAQMLSKIERQRADSYFDPEFNSQADWVEYLSGSDRHYYFQYQLDMLMGWIFAERPDIAEQSGFTYPSADEIAGILVNDEGQAEFTYTQAYGMNANSKNKTLAWAFIKFLMSEEMQKSLSLWGFPINKEAFGDYTKGFFADGIAGDGVREITIKENIDAYRAYIERLDGFISDLSYYAITDRVIDNMFVDEVGLFLKGSKSAEETAAALQNKAQLYLNE